MKYKQYIVIQFIHSFAWNNSHIHLHVKTQKLKYTGQQFLSFWEIHPTIKKEVLKSTFKYVMQYIACNICNVCNGL